MEKILRTAEKFIPKKVFRFFQPFYHYKLALIGAIFYGFPARKLFVIGVTGTKGKSSVTEIINAILETAGEKTALSNTIRFKIDKNSRPNKYKMSMPGRFFMQKFLHDAVKAGCKYAVVEITSEGSRQFRHKFIWLDAFVFTNLAPEHIESHGSYEKYREAKLRIVDNLKKKKNANFERDVNFGRGANLNQNANFERDVNLNQNANFGRGANFEQSAVAGQEAVAIINADDKEAGEFLKRVDTINNAHGGFAVKKITYSLTDAKPIIFGEKTEMRFKKNTLYSVLPGEFNVYNILAAATLASEIGIGDEVIKSAVENLSEIPGRAQKVKIQPAQEFDVIVDYAHTPESLTELYKAFPRRKRICVLGNTGGGRDKWKRPTMAKIAEKYCSEIILTDEDPYDEDPAKIVSEMKSVITKKPVKIIMDRRLAIHQAIKDAQKGDAVLISGKGTDPYIMGPNGQKTPWSDYDVAKEELSKILKKSE